MRLDAEGASSPAWSEYLTTLNVLLALKATDGVAGSNGGLLSTREMADRMGVAPKTLLRWRAQGRVKPAVQIGQRGRAAVRWKGTETISEA